MAVTKPKKAEGNYKRRGDFWVIITHLPGQDKWNEFSIVAGYNFKTDSNPEVTIGDVKFQLFTGSRAWSFSPSEDEKNNKIPKICDENESCWNIFKRYNYHRYIFLDGFQQSLPINQ